MTDIQYAECEDGKSFRGNPRYYRSALSSTREALREFQRQKVQAILNLGDIVDAKSSENTDCLKTIVREFEQVPSPVHHLYGNHELEVVPNRCQLRDILQIPFHTEGNCLVGYYSTILPCETSDDVPNLRLVVLDTYDVCLQRPERSDRHQQALELLTTSNPNHHNFRSPEGLVGVDRRMVSMGGAVGAEQLKWLRRELEQARETNERVIVCSHQPLLPESVEIHTLFATLCWNYQDVLDVLGEFKDVVALSLSGHAHRDGIGFHEGIPFRVLEATLENKEPTFSILEWDGSSVRIQGSGACPSSAYEFLDS